MNLLLQRYYLNQLTTLTTGLSVAVHGPISNLRSLLLVCAVCIYMHISPRELKIQAFAYLYFSGEGHDMQIRFKKT